MKAKDVQIGQVYTMKVGANTTGVRITSEHPHGGWVGININTEKSVHITSADRLCGIFKAKTDDNSPLATPTKPQTNEPEKNLDSPKAQCRQGSGLAGVIKVLEEAGMPLRCKEIVKCMLAKEYWQTEGKTPEATISSAITREIKEKGTASRFRKTERGVFTLNS